MRNLVEVLNFPASALLAISFLLTAFSLHRYAKCNAIVLYLKRLAAARILLAILAAMLLVEGTWSIPLHQSPFFVLCVLVLLFALAFVILDGIASKAKIGFLLNHIGIFLIVWAGVFGAPDVARTKMLIGKNLTENISYEADGRVVPMPFSVTLQDFVIDYYDDGITPRQYTSYLIVDGCPMKVAVNEPSTFRDYTFYQESYDREAKQYTVLQVVQDPWLPFVYLGMLLLACGSIGLLFGKWKARVVLPITFVLTILFTFFSVAKINFGMLMPALRSWWFVPHLFIYMVAYSLMAMALFVWFYNVLYKHLSYSELSNNLMRSSSALLIVGMLTGAVWARQAWGDYWAWDPKENWAAVTWLLTLLHLHLQDKRGWKAFAILVLAFLSLQITWYGVNYLPSAIHSMHTYNNG